MKPISNFQPLFNNLSLNDFFISRYDRIKLHWTEQSYLSIHKGVGQVGHEKTHMNLLAPCSLTLNMPILFLWYWVSEIRKSWKENFLLKRLLTQTHAEEANNGRQHNAADHKQYHKYHRNIWKCKKVKGLLHIYILYNVGLLTFNTRNIIGHQVASLLAVTEDIGDILGERQTSAVWIIASDNRVLSSQSCVTQDVLPARSTRLVTRTNIGDQEDLPSTSVIATVGILLLQKKESIFK